MSPKKAKPPEYLFDAQTNQWVEDTAVAWRELAEKRFQFIQKQKCQILSLETELAIATAPGPIRKLAGYVGRGFIPVGVLLGIVSLIIGTVSLGVFIIKCFSEGRYTIGGITATALLVVAAAVYGAMEDL